MILPDLKEFLSLALQGNLIPVWTTVPADLLTPVSAYLKLTGRSARQARGRGYSFLLESVEGGETVARYTYMGCDPFLVLGYSLPSRIGTAAGDPGQVEIIEGRRRRRVPGDLMTAARTVCASFRPARVEALPPFAAGAVGYLGYDLIALREPVSLPPREKRAKGSGTMPEGVLMFFTTVLVFDHVKHEIIVVSNVDARKKMGRTALARAYQEAVGKIRQVEKRLARPLPLPEAGPSARRPAPPSAEFRSNFSKEKFLQVVRRTKEHITAGDIFQGVLSQRLETPLRADAFEVYRALRRVNPAPYLFFLQLGKDCVLGSSPEMLVKVSGEDVEYRPIAGTRPRGKDPAEDQQLAQELLADEKERAEHMMLVDLGRNDIGRVCRYGSVQAPNLMFVERYSHVMHLVSSVKGKLRPEFDAWDAFWACFPAGTVTGAPKVRAMQIISDLEPTRRGVYAGAVLYLDFSGNLNSCIAIRSIVISGGKASVQAGAGIVADSVPEREYEETLNKAKAMLTAIRMAPVKRKGARR